MSPLGAGRRSGAWRTRTEGARHAACTLGLEGAARGTPRAGPNPGPREALALPQPSMLVWGRWPCVAHAGPCEWARCVASLRAAATPPSPGPARTWTLTDRVEVFAAEHTRSRMLSAVARRPRILLAAIIANLRCSCGKNLDSDKQGRSFCRGARNPHIEGPIGIACRFARHLRPTEQSGDADIWPVAGPEPCSASSTAGALATWRASVR